MAVDLGDLQKSIEDLLSLPLRAPNAAVDAPTINSPKFSIVMPSFNSVEYIEKSIVSVVNQDYNNVELIVIDGGSTDGTLDVIEAYNPYISYWHSRHDGGQSDALNAGFKVATGDIFAWLNSDDLYCPGAFRHAAAAFEDPRVSLAYGDWLSIGPSDEILFRHVCLPPSLSRLAVDGFQFNLQAAFWRSSLHRQTGGFDVRLRRTMDYDFAAALLSSVERAQVAMLERPLGCFRRHPAQKTQSFDPEVAREQRLIADKRGFAWKYSSYGKALAFISKLIKVLFWLRRGAVHEIARATRFDRLLRFNDKG